ncbi:hypothetical protein FXO37_09684 [Capsicum annuum]|nr:hypothetical protein FXO37_09684 [Capsicum annuum]
MDEIWINYCGMPVCFGLQEFAIVMGLRCHHLEELPIAKGIPRKRSKARKYKKKINELFDIARRGYKASDLLTDLMDKTIPKRLGHLKPFLPSESKSSIAQHVTQKIARLMQLVVYPWIVPTQKESMMTSYITLGHVDTIADPTVALINKELAGAITIRRAVGQGQPNVEASHDQPTKADLGTSSGGVVGVGGRYADAATTYDDEHVDAQEKIDMFKNTPFHPYTTPSQPSPPSCSHCECEEWKDSQDKLFEKVEAISKAIEEFKSKKIREPYTPTVLVKRKKKTITDVLSGRK